ncbi:hypothetical protein U1Q18_000190 [Sarracenia purpurea var. burkii]
MLLSTEENPSSDPPCPCEISQLKSGDERDSSDKVALQEVDLLNSSALDEIETHPLPKFSIRDYVFEARSKDIKNNWPFSQRNLQLCLKYGVKELLPPFWPLEIVRNGSNHIRRCPDETNLIEKERTSNSDGEPSGPRDHFISVSSDNAESNDSPSVDCVNRSSSGSKGDKQLPLTTDNQSRSEVDSERNLRSPAKLEITGSPATQSTNQSPIKKCRLIVKVGSGAYPSSKEEDTPAAAANCVAFPEAMASKVCPVCKNFSSPSNTTLNAHIDQCLSPESSIKWSSANSRVIKHRIKPRKTRLMVDIYETAPHCTLEELDRRNGTSWAMNYSFPTQKNVEFSEEEKQRVVAPVNFEDKGDDEGSVYIDANGTKLRILSKFNEAFSVRKIEAGLKHRKPFKAGGKGSKLLSTYKKKHNKYLKLALQSKQSCSSKPRCAAEVCGDGEENRRKQECPTQPFKAQEQAKPNDSGTMMKWARSKRTGLLKKRSRREGLHHLGRSSMQELPVESDQSSLGDSYMKGSHIQKAQNSCRNPLSSPESSKRMENSSLKAPFIECNEESPVRKGVGFTTSFGSQISSMKRLLEPPQRRRVKHLTIDSTSVDGSCKDFANNGENYVPFLAKVPVKVNTGPVNNVSRDVCSNLPRKNHALSSKAPKFSSIRKHMLVSQSSVPKSKHKVKRKCSTSKKSGVSCMEDSKVVGKYDSKEKHDGNQSRIEEITGKISLERCSVFKIRKKRGTFGNSHDKESVSLKLASECQSHEVGNNIDSSGRVGCDLADTFDDTESGRSRIQTYGKNSVVEPSSGENLGGHITSLSKSLDPFQSVVFRRSLCGAETPSCPINPSLDDEQEMFCLDEVGNSMIDQNADEGAGMDSKVEQGSYFTEVDPIPIPGPPGSFLPSPRDMGSEDLQGNSSITTSRVHSSEDHNDLVDRDSSDSPVSAMSTISNSMNPRSDSKSSQKLSAGSQVTQDEIRLDFSVPIHDAVAENTSPVPQEAIIPAERINQDKLKENMIAPETVHISFRNDQPCCCSRKEGMSQGVSLNYQDSQLLRRRTMASVPVPAMGKQLGCDPNGRPYSLNSLPELVSLGNFQGSGPAKPVDPVTKSVASPISADPALKSPTYGDCDTASPSASNPVLRLMGKNLMVVNKDDNNVSQQFRPIQSSSMNDHPNPQFQTHSGVSPGNILNKGFPSFYHTIHQHPFISGQNQWNPGFEVKQLSNSFGSYVTSKTPQTSSHASSGVFLSKTDCGGFTPSSESHEYKIQYNLPNDQYRTGNRSRANPSAYNLENVAAISATQHRKADSTINPMKEIIIVDDTPDEEVNSAEDAPYSEEKREIRASSAGISMPMAASYNSRHGNPFYSYQPQDSSPCSGSHVIQSASFQMPTHGSANASPVKWNCTSEGLVVPPASSIMASSSSSSRLRSSLYYFPSFS